MVFSSGMAAIAALMKLFKIGVWYFARFGWAVKPEWLAKTPGVVSPSVRPSGR